MSLNKLQISCLIRILLIFLQFTEGDSKRIGYISFEANAVNCKSFLYYSSWFRLIVVDLTAGKCSTFDRQMSRVEELLHMCIALVAMTTPDHFASTLLSCGYSFLWIQRTMVGPVACVSERYNDSSVSFKAENLFLDSEWHFKNSEPWRYDKNALLAYHPLKLNYKCVYAS
jgi:hypothetical protein